MLIVLVGALGVWSFEVEAMDVREGFRTGAIFESSQTKIIVHSKESRAEGS
jgi:hypothetical protein